MSQDRFSHLNALEFRLFNEEVRLNNATNDREIEMRQVWVDGIKKEIIAEREFLGLSAKQEEVSFDELDAFVELLKEDISERTLNNAWGV